MILLTGWNRADPIASLVVAALMVKAGTGLVRESGRIFLEAAPRGIDPAAIDAAIHATDGVVGVHDLHVWQVNSGFPAPSAHLLVSPTFDCHRTREDLEAALAHRFGITHTTLQVDHRTDLIADARIPLHAPDPRPTPAIPTRGSPRVTTEPPTRPRRRAAVCAW